MQECIFCDIANRKENADDFEYEDDTVAAFSDISPKAPIHILIVPKKHIQSVAQLAEEDENLIGRLILAAKKVAEKRGINEDGYRLIFNIGKHSGQIVDHLHLHLLGGRELGTIG